MYILTANKLVKIFIFNRIKNLKNKFHNFEKGKKLIIYSKYL